MSKRLSTWERLFPDPWQLRQQVEYWKALAISRQFENSVFREIIRSNHLALLTVIPQRCDATKSDSKVSEVNANKENEEDESDEELEVSEQFIHFIQFIFKNAKYREHASRGRESLKTKFEAESKEEAIELLESVEDMSTKKNKLCGDHKEIIDNDEEILDYLNEESDSELKVREEFIFIQFLKAYAKYKKNNRHDWKRLKTKLEGESRAKAQNNAARSLETEFTF